MASSSSRKQQIRPRYLDLAEFDDDESGESSFSNWPPAATVVRKPPPSIKPSKSQDVSTSPSQTQTARNATVEDGLSEASSVPPSETLPEAVSKTVRFETGTEPVSSPQQKARRPLPTEDSASSSSSASARASPLSMIGTVQERPKGLKSTTRNPTAKPRASRFVVARQMDEELRLHDQKRLNESEPHAVLEGSSTGFPVVTHRDQIDPILPSDTRAGRPRMDLSDDVRSVAAPQSDDIAIRSALRPSAGAGNPDLEEWLDEDGRPMSAFRKSRLLRQGLRPSSVRKVQHHDDDHPTYVRDPTRDPGGGADIDAISAVLAEVSRENDQKLRQMSSTEITEEVKGLESLFGKDVLEALRSRRKPNDKFVDAVPAERREVSIQVQVDDDSERIRRQYFPTEPGGVRPELEWLSPQSQNPDRDELRFDFKGVLLETSHQTDESYLSGLHHHGDNQTAPGYTFSELVHLTRSSVAAQRQLALNVLGRICDLYPTFPAGDADAVQAKVSAFLNSVDLLPRARVVMLARWLLDDRNFTVRSAALRCLASVLRSLPAGPAPISDATLSVDWRKLRDNRDGAAEEQNDASDVECSIQTDWATTMLDSKIMSVMLEQTDAVITSHWEAETALEVLYRIASCSASHSLRVFGEDSKQVCDFIVHLGLQVTWPPVQGGSADGRRGSFNAAPSFWALRLMHVGILADRKLAQAMIVDGSIDHLLRFVVSPPWDLDAGNSESIMLLAYDVFDAVLQIYISLASYGMYATLVGRTWSLWQESGSWAVSRLNKEHVGGELLQSSELRSTKHKVAQSIFMLLAGWTRCSQDPHELMSHHDVTWTQVRDWINLLENVPNLAAGVESDGKREKSEAATSLLGAMCQFTTVWLECALQKDPSAVKRNIGVCRQLFIFCNGPIRSALRNMLQPASVSDPGGIADAVRTVRSVQRLAALLSSVSKISQDTITEPLTPEIVHENVSYDVALLVQSSTLWNALESKEARFTGRYIFKEVLTSFIASTITEDVPTPRACVRNLVAVSRLDSTYCDLVARILMKSSTYLGGQSVSHVLKPFLVECAGSTAMAENDRAPTDRSLSNVTSLFRPAQQALKSVNAVTVTNDDDRDNAGEKEVDKDDFDPITGTKLWRCAASGLPLRADWPLLALDDLLHSATTAVFNRPDNLEADWQANELDIVRASLRLAVKTFDCLFKLSISPTGESEQSVEARAALRRLPSAEQILLGVMKVFMLEKDQPDTFVDKRVSGSKQQRPSGALTGRDLFRDPLVSSYLALLLDHADQLVEFRRQDKAALLSTTTLEAWTATTIGNGVSFYQYFTDLVGLYDSISFGDRNFARIVMTIANAGGQRGIFEGTTGLAKDFRSLVWNDYRDSLRSMPEMPCPEWTLHWFDQDLDMLDLYARFLVSVASQTPARKSIAYTIAVHHLRPAVQGCASSSGDKVPRLVLIIKSLVEACGPHILRDLLSASSDKAPSTDSAVQDHLKLLNATLGLTLSI